MRPHERTFDGWWELYFESESGSDAWWESIDNMFHTAHCKEDWRRVHGILEWEEHGPFKEYFSKFRNFELWRIATDGMCLALSRQELEALRLAQRPWWQKMFDLFQQGAAFQIA